MRGCHLELSSEGNGPTGGGWHDLEATVVATDTLGTDGTPLIYDIGTDGAGLTDAVVDGVEAATMHLAFDMDAVVEDDGTDPLGVDATCFVRQVTPSAWFGPTWSTFGTGP